MPLLQASSDGTCDCQTAGLAWPPWLHSVSEMCDGWVVQAHLLRIVDPVTGQPLTLDRLEDEASIMFVVRMATLDVGLFVVYMVAYF